MGMSVDTLVRVLEDIKKNGGDEEIDHANADDALIEFIDDERVTEAFNAINKWYA